MYPRWHTCILLETQPNENLIPDLGNTSFQGRILSKEVCLFITPKNLQGMGVDRTESTLSLAKLTSERFRLWSNALLIAGHIEEDSSCTLDLEDKR